jgi:hypothetical protein
VLTCTASGEKLKPAIIFKGKNCPRGLIENLGIKAVWMQKNAWMDRPTMLAYVNSLPEGDDYKLLIMDSFSVHKDIDVLQALERERYKTVFVPSGYTDIYQPLDVSIMRPYKYGMRNLLKTGRVNFHRQADVRKSPLSKQ